MAADRIAALIVCLIVGAVAVAGCGSGEERSDKDYVAELQDVATSFGAGANKLSKQISELGPLTLKSAGALLQTFSDQVDELAAEIDDVDPPAAVEQLHARLLALLESFGSKAQQAAIALKAGDLLGGLPALTGFAVEAAEVGGQVDGTIEAVKSQLGVD